VFSQGRRKQGAPKASDVAKEYPISPLKGNPIPLHPTECPSSRLLEPANWEGLPGAVGAIGIQP